MNCYQFHRHRNMQQKRLQALYDAGLLLPTFPVSSYEASHYAPVFHPQAQPPHAMYYSATLPTSITNNSAHKPVVVVARPPTAPAGLMQTHRAPVPQARGRKFFADTVCPGMQLDRNMNKFHGGLAEWFPNFREYEKVLCNSAGEMRFGKWNASCGIANFKKFLQALELSNM